MHRKNWAVLGFLMRMQQNTIVEGDKWKLCLHKVQGDRWDGPCSGSSIVLAA